MSRFLVMSNGNKIKIPDEKESGLKADSEGGFMMFPVEVVCDTCLSECYCVIIPSLEIRLACSKCGRMFNDDGSPIE